ncbi:integral membrane protein [Aspergillus flavus]|nr:integral membrane protein [Aspergillus flavus]
MDLVRTAITSSLERLKRSSSLTVSPPIMETDPLLPPYSSSPGYERERRPYRHRQGRGINTTPPIPPIQFLSALFFAGAVIASTYWAYKSYTAPERTPLEPAPLLPYFASLSLILSFCSWIGYLVSILYDRDDISLLQRKLVIWISVIGKVVLGFAHAVIWFEYKQFFPGTKQPNWIIMFLAMQACVIEQNRLVRNVCEHPSLAQATVIRNKCIIAMRTRNSAKEIAPQSRRAFKAAVVAQSLQSLPASLPSSTSAESVGFFFRYYVLDDVHNIPIYLSASQMEVLAATNPLVMQSLVAVGLAGLSNIKKSTELMTKATGEYTQALHLINCTLKDGTQCKSDATLAATMLLGMFEVLTCNTPSSLQSWAQHVRGAAALIEMRGAEQIKWIVGMRMFTHLRVQIIASCLHWRLSVPASIVHWSLQAMAERSTADAKADELVDLVAHVARLLSQARMNLASDTVSSAATIDRYLLRWKHSLPPRWIYQTIRGPVSNRSPSHLKFYYTQVYHVYPDLWACNIWNFYRSARILLNQLILNTAEISYQAEHVQIRETVAQLATEIAESVPFALRLVDNRATEVPSLDHCLGGFTILWPLYVAANTSPLGSTLREWVVERLETIGNDMGIGQAQFMARTIRNTSAPVP